MQLVKDNNIAWHAGISNWFNFKNLNKNSIGIELENKGHQYGYQDFPNKQITELIKILKRLKKKFKIQNINITGHSDIAPHRKTDPGEKFPWKKLYKNDLAIWHSLDEKFINNFRLKKLINIKKKNMVKMIKKLGNHHAGDKAALTISQANAVASVGFIAGTLLIGTIATNYPDKWRLGLFLVIPISLFIYLFLRDKKYVDHVFDDGARQTGKMSWKFWISWVGFIACIGSEFATSFWAASLFKDRVGGSAGVATTVMLAYGIGMGIGRWYMGQILFKLHLDQQLLTVIGIQFIGFGIFWFSHNFLLSLVALFLIGVGLSTQFALVSLRLIDLSDGRPDQAIGLSSLAAGIAIALAPFALGLLDDQFGISRAYIMVPVLIAIAFVVVVAIPTHVSQKKVHEAEGISE